MANTSISFRKGLAAELPEQKTPGRIYITTDERAIYFDIDENVRIRLGGFQEYATPSDLDANEHPDPNALYYVTSKNYLMRWNGSGYETISAPGAGGPADFDVIDGGSASGIN